MVNNIVPIKQRPIPPPSMWDIANYLYSQGESAMYMAMKEVIHSSDKLRVENNNLKAWHQALDNKLRGVNTMARIKFQIGEQTMECEWDMSKDPLVILLSAEGSVSEAEHHEATLKAGRAVTKVVDSNTNSN